VILDFRLPIATETNGQCNSVVVSSDLIRCCEARSGLRQQTLQRQTQMDYCQEITSSAAAPEFLSP
jgi:hypothetical protein